MLIQGKDYDQAAKRELKEELGIECQLKMLGKFYEENNHGDIKHKVFSGVFLGFSDKDPELNDELVEFKKMTIQEIEKCIEENPGIFCCGFINDFNRVKNQL